MDTRPAVDMYQRPLSDQAMHPAHAMAINMDIAPTISTDMVPDDPTSMDITVNKRSIAAVSSGCGRLVAVGIKSDDTIWTKYWTESSSESEWTTLDGLTKFPPAAVSTKPDHLEVFAIALSGEACSNYFDGSSWQGWLCFGGIFTSSLTVTSWGPDHVDFFGVGLDGGIWHKSYDESTGWRPYISLGPHFKSEPAAISWGPGRIDVFGIGGGDGAMYWRYFADGVWSSAYESLGGSFKSPPTIVSRRPGRLSLFAIDSNSGALLHKYFSNGAWNANWENLGGVLYSAVSAVTSTFAGNDRIDLFALGHSNRVVHKAWVNNAWTTWTAHGQAFSSEPAATRWCADRLEIFGIGSTDKAVWHQSWNGSDWLPSIKGWESVGGTFNVFP